MVGRLPGALVRLPLRLAEARPASTQGVGLGVAEGGLPDERPEDRLGDAARLPIQPAPTEAGDCPTMLRAATAGHRPPIVPRGRLRAWGKSAATEEVGRSKEGPNELPRDGQAGGMLPVPPEERDYPAPEPTERSAGADLAHPKFAGDRPTLLPYLGTTLAAAGADMEPPVRVVAPIRFR